MNRWHVPIRQKAQVVKSLNILSYVIQERRILKFMETYQNTNKKQKTKNKWDSTYQKVKWYNKRKDVITTWEELSIQRTKIRKRQG